MVLKITLHGTHDISPRYSKYPPTFIMISPHGTEHSHGTQDIPHGTHDISHGTEHPHGTAHIIQGDFVKECSY